MENIRILIVGTGAIGSFYGGKLFQAGAKVSTLCRSDYNVVKESGISIKSIDGNFHFTPEEVIKEVNDYSGIPDYIVVATKVLPGIDINKLIKPKVGKETTIVLIQNGIDIEKSFTKEFPDNEIISCLAFICVSRLKFGEIWHQDYGRLVIGSYPCGITKKVEKLYDLFNIAKINCIIDDNIVSSRWKKLVWNAPFNPISVIGGGIDTKTILENQEAMRLVKNIMEEVIMLARKSGYDLSMELIDKNIEDTVKMNPYKTSMLLDFEQKRPLEVEAILGNTVRIARNFNIPVPNLETLYALLLLLDQNSH